MRMSVDGVRKLCISSLNETITEHALDLGIQTDAESQNPARDASQGDEELDAEVFEDQESDS